MKRKILLHRIGIGLILAAAIPVIMSFSPFQHSVQAQAYATPTLAGFLFPTDTPTQLGGPTATPSRTPSVAPVLAQALGTPTNLRSGPGLNFDIVGELKAGDTIPIIGRSVTLPWLVVLWAQAPEGKAWVFNDLVTVLGDITTVPVVEPPSQPTIEPTLAALQQTATIVLQTPGAAETATAAAFFQPTGAYTVTPGGVTFGGVLPTFTPPEPYIQPSVVAPPVGSTAARSGLPPAMLIVGLGFLGAIMLGLGLLRRL
jgi:hypothetical protein